MLVLTAYTWLCLRPSEKKVARLKMSLSKTVLLKGSMIIKVRQAQCSIKSLPQNSRNWKSNRKYLAQDKELVQWYVVCVISTKGMKCQNCLGLLREALQEHAKEDKTAWDAKGGHTNYKVPFDQSYLSNSNDRINKTDTKISCKTTGRRADININD